MRGQRCGHVKINRELRITRFLEKQEFSSSGYKNCGMHICARKIFDFLPFRKEFSLENDFFPKDG
jgi:NDP-sugar pyrophosphorylase family protein